MAVLALIAGCSALVSLDGLSGGGDVSATEAGAGEGGNDGQSPADAGTDGASASDARAPDGGRLPRIYVFGGTSDGVNYTPSTSQSFYAQVQADGALGPWTPGPNLPEPLIWANAAAGTDFVAVPGGLVQGAGSVRSILIGRVTDGEVVSFFRSSAVLPRAVDHAGVVVKNDVLYVLGGTGADGGAQSGAVAPSSVGAFRVSDVLPPLRQMAFASNASAVYLAGGRDGSDTLTASIVRGELLADGGITPFVAQTSLPAPCYYSAAAIYRESLLVIGGDLGGTRATNVLVYPIAPSGELGAVRTTAALPAARSRHDAVVVGDKVYVLGGDVAQPGDARDVLAGDLASDGSVMTWRTVSQLPTPLIFAATALVY